MKKLTAIIILISSLVIAGSILGYGYMNYKYRMEVLENEKQSKAEELKNQTEQQRAREMKLISCKSEAERSHDSWWHSSCKNFGTDIEYENEQVYSQSAGKVVTQKEIKTCSLPSYIQMT